MLYLILFLFLFFLSLLEIQHKKLPSWAYYFVIIFLIAIAAFRLDTGTDYAAYLKLWTNVPPFTELISKHFRYAELEVGFVLMMSLLKQLAGASVLFWGACASLFFFPFSWGIRKLALPYVFVALLVYLMSFYIPYAFNGMRQAIAMSIFIVSVPFILQRNNLMVIALSLLAISFHLSGLLILCAYLVQFYRGNLIPVMLIGGASAVVLSQLNVLSFVLFDVIGISKVYVQKFTESTSLFKLATRTLLLLAFFYFYQRGSEAYKKVFTMYLLGFFIYVGLAEYNVLATRFNMFFRVLEVIMLPLLLANITQLKQRVLCLLLFLIPYGYSFYTSAMHPDNWYQFLFAAN
ncbi:hypothetical protein GVX76_06465 [[Haemophilus] felis]|nr:hypothetical protein [[Haemophilus] felis]